MGSPFLEQTQIMDDNSQVREPRSAVASSAIKASVSLPVYMVAIDEDTFTSLLHHTLYSEVNVSLSSAYSSKWVSTMGYTSTVIHKSSAH